LRLHAVCYYRSKSEEWTENWRNVDYTARNIVKAVKRKPFNGFSLIKSIAGKVFRIDDTASGQEIAMGFAAQNLARLISAAGYQQVAVIPVPSSSHTKAGAEFTGSRLAERIQKVNPCFVAKPVLYLANAIPSSSQGGGRDANLIEATLRATNEINQIESAVLLDDVYTSGAHVRGAARFLNNQGIEIEDVFVVGRTCWEKPESMFKCATEEIHCALGNEWDF
jgi:hypothetical protein